MSAQEHQTRMSDLHTGFRLQVSKVGIDYVLTIDPPVFGRRQSVTFTPGSYTYLAVGELFNAMKQDAAR